MVSAAIKKYLAVWLQSTLHFTRPVVGSVLVYRLGCSGNWQVYRQLLHALQSTTELAHGPPFTAV